MLYKSQIVCIFIILFIAAFYFYSERKTASAKWFSSLLITAVVQLLFDIGSVYTVNHLETVPPILNRIVHCIFMSLLLALFLIAYKYLEALIEEARGERIQRIKFAVIPVIIATFSLCFLPIKYVETPKGNYSHGPAVFGVGIVPDGRNQLVGNIADPLLMAENAPVRVPVLQGPGLLIHGVDGKNHDLT